MVRIARLATVVVGVALVAGIAAAPSFAKARTYSAEYHGSASWSDDLSGNVADPAGNESVSETFTWDVKISARYASSTATPTIQKSLTASGSTTVTDYDGTFTCTFHRAADPDLGAEELSADRLGNGKVAISAYLGMPETVPGEIADSGPSECQVASVAGEAAEGGLGDVCAGFPANAQSREAIASLDFPLQTSTSTSRRIAVNQAVTVNNPCMGAPGTTETITRKISAVATIGGASPCASTTSAADFIAAAAKAPSCCAGGPLTVRARPQGPLGHAFTFSGKSGTHVALFAAAAGGCHPYHYSWHLLKPGGRHAARYWQFVHVKPSSASSAAFSATLTCAVPRKDRRQGIMPLAQCKGIIPFRVTVTDSAHPARKGHADVNIYWDGCIQVSPDLKKAIEEKRQEIENELWTVLGKHGIKFLTVGKLIEYLAGEELAPALVLNDIAEAGLNWLELQHEWQEYNASLNC
jgi:hypothetical protein